MIRTYRRCGLLNQSFMRIFTAQKSTVAVAMSGGIDSSVAAMILKDQGYDCVGVFMTNWDSSDEVGDVTCNIDRDRIHMREVCERLDIPAVDVDFVKDYWNDVFMPFLDSYRSGVETPNPDVMCNRLIKFNRFREHVTTRLGIRTMATGHYVRIQNSAQSIDDKELSAQSSSFCSGHDTVGFQQSPRLLRGIDDMKDQSYFLSMTRGDDLKNVLFPLGGLQKQEVKRMASDRFKGLAVLTKKESMGVCFIGKRNIQEFLSNYIPMTPGRFIDADSGLIIGRHEGKEAFTVGQKANVGGFREKYFVVSLTASAKGVERKQGDVLVAMGTRHPMLYHRSLIVRSDRMNWIAGSPPVGILDQLSALQRDSQSMESRGVDMPHNIDLPTVSSSSNCNNDSSSCSDGSSSSSSSNISHLVRESNTVDSPIGFRCGFKARYLQAIEQCTITVRLLPFDRTSSPVAAGSSTRIMSTESANTSTSHATLDIINTAPDPRPHLNYELVVTFDQPHRAVTPGQILALYAGDECLGGGVISLSDMP